MDVIINNPADAATPVYTPYAAAPAPYGYGGPTGPGWGHHGGGGFWVVFAVIAVVVIARARRRAWMGGGGPGRDRGAPWRRAARHMPGALFGEHALNIARERLARGEISASEYATIRDTLRQEEPERPADVDTDRA
ncbi:hypothetical protein [Deinococcus maricopensis]|uniref:SHOCT domain-containing protein n=1 Tax=Deinococcus maricopensis (strain DSM 21211 / LMG 22137 / NRRL B-23946 / LB-34) TaxID=709986 RepID=E8UBR5_DEIML|nr:hypothetical protein [Deinococcus maricopensis]ADV68504.1 Protein of unknown function DUF2078, membrane [Deinococcus maricopensis DSM 21211]